jgi:hypothetical protein
VLGLTDPGCVDPSLGATAALALAKWQAEIARGTDPSALADVPESDRARLRVRRAVVEAQLAYAAARAGDVELARSAGQDARKELALADATALGDDRPSYDEAALRVAAVRWAGEPAPAPAASGVQVEVAAGEPGQTCVRVAKKGAPAFAHCTYGVVWPSSVRVAPHDAAVVVAVQPLPGWAELHVLHPSSEGWTVDTMAPAPIDPELGYVELAGFSPDGAHLAVVRESRATGPLGAPNTLAPWMQRSFQVLSTKDLHVEKQASTLASFPTFKHLETPEWARGTVALR